MTKRALMLASREARELRHTSIQPKHLLLALLRLGDSAIEQAFRAAGVEIDEAIAGLSRSFSLGKAIYERPRDLSGNPYEGEVIPFSKESVRLLEQSWMDAESKGCERIEPTHILSAFRASRSRRIQRYLPGHFRAPT